MKTIINRFTSVHRISTLVLTVALGLVMTSGTVLSASKALEQIAAKQTSSESAPALDSLQCVAGLESKVAKILGHADDESYYSACRVMPSDTKKSIVALSYKQEGSETDSNHPDEDYYDLDVLIVESGTEKVLSHLFQKKAYTSEVMMSFASIVIDTGRYKLAPSVRAFGVRAFYEHEGVTWFKSEAISLFVIQGNKLKQVLGNLEISSSYGDKYFGNDEQRINCMESHETEGTLAVDNNTRHGYADLLLRERTVEDYGETNDNGCVQKKVSHRQYKLRFNGDVYEIPEELRY